MLSHRSNLHQAKESNPPEAAAQAAFKKKHDMKRKIVFIFLASGLLFAGTAQGQRRTKLRTTADSISYYLGIDFAHQMKRMSEQWGRVGLEVSTKGLIAAIEDTFAPRRSSREPNPEEAYAFLQDYFNVRLPAENLRASEAWLAEVERTTPGIQRTESGLLYQIVDPRNSLRAVRDEDRVEVDYVGQLRDGTVVDSSHERGQSQTFPLRGVIPGWSEGLKLVGEGGTIRLWISPELAYGESRAGSTSGIPPNAALYFEVEVLDVIPAEE